MYGTSAISPTVAPGAAGASPLADVRNVRALEGVMLAGRWLDAAQLAALRESVATAVARAK